MFQFAANIWAGIPSSTVEIRVHANFDPLFCTTNSAVLGQGGPATMWRDFAGAPLAGHWYHAALANRYAGSDLSGGDDVNITFNSSLGASNCMPAGWYYGVDGNEGSQIELLPVVLHELAHGLGFSTATDGSTGNYASGYPTVYDHYLLDVGTGKHWDEMSATERAASAVACRRLVWDGTSVKQHAPPTLNDRSLLRVNAPAGIAGRVRRGRGGVRSGARHGRRERQRGDGERCGRIADQRLRGLHQRRGHGRQDRADRPRFLFASRPR